MDVGRLARWWDENKSKCLFQTDRLRIKTQNKLVETFVSYKKLIGAGTQEAFFKNMSRGASKKNNYDTVFDAASGIKNFGRFSNFIYLELLYELTGMNITPSKLDVQNATSCMNGLCYAIDRPDLLDRKLDKQGAEQFEKVYDSLCRHSKKNHGGLLTPYSAWGVETTLCAFKKHKKQKRWIGYYIDRQHDEIKKLEQAVTQGVNWQPLWDFRQEHFDPDHLTENTGERSSITRRYD